MAEKANHHFIPQFYLRGFSPPGDRRKAQVFVFDKHTKKTFRTLVRNVGSRRHFFRINAEGFDPNHIEDGMAEIETDLAAHLAEVIEANEFPTDAHFSSIMLLMGNVAVRNPRFRSMLEDIHTRIVGGMMHMLLQDKNRFDDSVRQARESGVPIRGDMNYEDIKAFIDMKEYKIVIDHTYLVGLELSSVPTVVEQLARRNWCFVSAVKGSTFATCEDPVVLSWVDGNDMRPFSPGFGLVNTIVMFPLTPELALVGMFKKMPDQRIYERDQVAAFNTSIAKNATKQLYRADGMFELHFRTEPFVRAKDLGAAFARQARQND